MATAEEKARDARANKTWIRSLIALGVVVVLGITGVTVYGTVLLPAENKAKDVAACKTFLVGYQKAQKAFVDEATAKDHTPDPKTAVANYAKALSNGYNSAFEQIGDQNSYVAKGMQQLALTRLRADFTTDSGVQQGFADLDNTAGTVENICQGVLEGANVKGKYGSYTPAPSAPAKKN
jgi:basic membrane lipoprotein Med (substrate-binding protein (PBP1-ABC) superfamily)